jgi:hypothetical protein
LAAAEKFSQFFLIAFFNSPCCETPKNAIKKNRAKQPREKKNSGGQKCHHFCVMSPDGFCFYRVFELPCYETPKNGIKKIYEAAAPVSSPPSVRGQAQCAHAAAQRAATLPSCPMVIVRRAA